MELPVEHINCAKCWEHVLGFAVRTKGKLYHDRCFRCNKCEKPLDKSHVVHEGRLMCLNCYVTATHPKCFRCQKEITDRYVFSAFGKHYHMNCFVCTKCNKRLEINQFWHHKQQIYCQDHLAEAVGRDKK